MKRTAALLGFAGMALAIALVASQGIGEVWSALAGAGWGLLAVCAFYPAALLMDTECWRLLFPAEHRPDFSALVLPRWICDAVNGLLPVAHVGGEFVRARLVAHRGIPGAYAGAGVVADITAGILTEILFTFAGIALLVRRGGGGGTVTAAAVGALLFCAIVALFLVAQRSGMFLRLARLLERLVQVGDWENVMGSARALDAAVMETYGRRREFLAACLWRMGGWLAGTLEVWLALFFLGRPVGIGEAVMLESLGQALRHAAFMVPGALGVQEGGFILLGSFVGIAPETGLALSLMKRIRELLVGLPALLLWQIAEGRRFFRARPQSLSADPGTAGEPPPPLPRAGGRHRLKISPTKRKK